MVNTSKSPYADWPVIGPILALLRSPEFFVMIVTLVVNAIISLHPVFEFMRTELMAITTLLGTLLLSGAIAARLTELKGMPFRNLPFWGPVGALLHSRKFWIGVGTLGADIAIAFIPQLEVDRAQLITVFTIIGTTLIGGIAYEDGKKNESQPLQPAVTVDEVKLLEVGSQDQIVAVAAAVMGVLLKDYNVFPKAAASPEVKAPQG